MILIFCPKVASADEIAGITLKLDVISPVLLCDVTLRYDQEALTSLLHDGTVVRVIWHLHIDEVRRYWLNTQVASVAITRSVIPDLVSGSWLLEDEGHGITRRVYYIDKAISFLLRLEKFPVVDYSLLETGVEYQFIATVDRRDGRVDDSWLASLWWYDKAQAETVFSLSK
ncbi:MAG: DUF4390 domain-containing protein [Mariprofundaceae bacterium]